MKRFGIIIFIMLQAALVGCGNTTYHVSGAENYDKDYIVTKYHSDLDSNLSIFPDEITEADNSIQYEALLSTSVFNTDARIILCCKYEPERLEEEVSRLENLSITIRYKDEQYTNNIKYDTEIYQLPAYIAIDGFGNTYEYSLVDRGNNKITYIYLAYPYIKDFPYPDYLKNDLSEYSEEKTLDAYSMYNHSFDNGKSWVEFDD